MIQPATGFIRLFSLLALCVFVSTLFYNDPTSYISITLYSFLWSLLFMAEILIALHWIDVKLAMMVMTRWEAIVVI
jgi:hypothetical protein